MSKKFTVAQQNYTVHELETLAILEALLKWEDKLVGYHVHIITNHKALEFFKTQISLSPRQMDPLGEDLPTYHFNEMKEHVVEICALRSMERQSCRLAELKEDHDLEAQVMAEANTQPTEPDLATMAPSIHDDLKGPHTQNDEDIMGTQPQNNEDISLAEALFNRAMDQQLTAPEDDQFLQAVQRWYKQDAILSIVINKPEENKGFTLHNSLIW
jgi:hypothetical protein